MRRICFIGSFLAILCFAQLVPAQDFPGAPDLEQAFEKKINAATLRDLDDVAALCQSALDKGLSDEGKEQAKELQASAWLEYSEQVEPSIIGPTRDTRWRFYRKEVLTRLEKAVELKPELANAHLMIARLNALEGGDRAKARVAVEKAIELAASNTQQLSAALMVRAELASTDDDRLNDLNQAVKVLPDNLDAIRMRGALYLKLEQPDKALEDFKLLSELEPENLDAYLVMVRVLAGLKRNDEAMEVLDNAIKKNPKTAGLLAFRARLQLDKTDGLEKQEADALVDKALNDAEAALAIDEKDIEALLVRAIILADKKRFDEALSDVNKVLEVQPLLVRGLWTRSVIQASNKNYVEAIKDVKTLASNDPTNEDLQLQLAALYNAMDEPRRALDVYDRILRIDPENPRALRGRGDAHLSLGQHPDAVKDYEESLELDPEDDGVLNNLAWVLATSTFDEVRNGKRAIELATKACEVTKYEQAHILSTLASGYAEVGEFENAIKWVKEGLAKSKEEKQTESLKKELEFYENKKPWRENQEEDRKKEEAKKADSGEKSEGGETKPDDQPEKKDGLQ
jgi:tetratricopeptide (TPR) repeat protein